MKIALIQYHRGMLAIPIEDIAALRGAQLVDVDGYGEHRTITRTNETLSLEIVDSSAIKDPEPPAAIPTPAPAVQADNDLGF